MQHSSNNSSSKVQNTNLYLLSVQFGIAALGLSGPQMSIPMRTHIMLEPAEKPGAAEKIFRIAEDWYGNEQLTEKNVKISLLGKIHQSVRRYYGQLVLWPVKQGLL